jgi:hypothetical protein
MIKLLAGCFAALLAVACNRQQPSTMPAPPPTVQSTAQSEQGAQRMDAHQHRHHMPDQGTSRQSGTTDQSGSSTPTQGSETGTSTGTPSGQGTHIPTDPGTPVTQPQPGTQDDGTSSDMQRPNSGPTDMRPTNSPVPPDTEQNRTGQSRTN